MAEQGGKGRGRPKLPDDRRRRVPIMIRCPGDLAEEFRRRAESKRLPLAAWIRMTCLEAIQKKKLA